MRKYLTFYLENNMVPIQHLSLLRYDAVSIGNFVTIVAVSRPRPDSRSATL